MATLLSETFAAGIPAGFAVRAAGGNPTAIYNSATQAVDLSFPVAGPSTGIYCVDSIVARTAFSVSFDIELISVQTTWRPYFGAHIVPSLATGVNGELIFQNSGGADVTTLSGSTNYYAFQRTGDEFVVGIGGSGLLVGARAIFTYETYINAGQRRYAVYRDGALLWAFENSLTADVQAGVVFSNCTVRLHSVVMTDTPMNIEATWATGKRGLAPAIGRKFEFTPPSRVAAISRFAGYHVKNTVYGGLGKISGTTKTLGVIPNPNAPMVSKVRLFRDLDGVLIAETASSTTGYYEFLNIDPTKKYTVLAIDPVHSYRAVVADNVSPEAMT